MSENNGPDWGEVGFWAFVALGIVCFTAYKIAELFA